MKGSKKPEIGALGSYSGICLERGFGSEGKVNLPDKEYYENHLQYCIKLAEPGALIVMDNVLARGSLADPDAEPKRYTAFMKAFNEKVTNHPQLESKLIPIGDGLTICNRANSQVNCSNSRINCPNSRVNCSNSRVNCKFSRISIKLSILSIKFLLISIKSTYISIIFLIISIKLANLCSGSTIYHPNILSMKKK